MRNLNLADLRRANVARLPEFKNALGGPAHSQPDGSDWSLGEWSNAVLGELGEAANLIKKIQRGDLSLEEGRPKLADELADVLTYLDILAFRAGIDLSEATVNKWNRVSERVGCSLFLDTSTSD
jgi:NTP pyrophosphatase (non-canonical NTP hydrolase)